MIWSGTKEELISFIDELNKKYKTIKFDYKIFAKQTELLDAMAYKDQQQKIQTAVFHKPTDQQTYLYAQSNQYKSLKDSIPYSQALRIKAYVQLPLNSAKTVTSLQKDLNKEGTRRIW